MKTNPTYNRSSSPTSWNTTSATLDYAGGNHRLVAIGSNATATVQRDFATNANEQHSLSYNLALLNGGSATVKVQQKVGNTYYDLAGSTQTHTASGTYNFNFTPTEANIRVVVNGNSRYALTQIFMDRNTIEEVIETYTLSAGGYRYGFQGQEKDDEVKGKGNSVNYTYRMHDPRLGRFFAVDPLAPKYPWNSPYVFTDNSPLRYIERGGADYILIVDYKAKTITVKATYNVIENDVVSHVKAKEAIEFWNSQSGKYQLVYGKGSDAGAFDILFDLNVNEVSDFKSVMKGGYSDLEFNKPNSLTFGVGTEDGQNAFKVFSDGEFSSIKAKFGSSESAVGVASGNYIAFPTTENKYLGQEAGPHEIGHTLGIDHFIGTIMGKNQAEIANKVSTEIIKVILGQEQVNFSPYIKEGSTGNSKVSVQEINKDSSSPDLKQTKNKVKAK